MFLALEIIVAYFHGVYFIGARHPEENSADEIPRHLGRNSVDLGHADGNELDPNNIRYVLASMQQCSLPVANTVKTLIHSRRFREKDKCTELRYILLVLCASCVKAGIVSEMILNA